MHNRHYWHYSNRMDANDYVLNDTYIEHGHTDAHIFHLQSEADAEIDKFVFIGSKRNNEIFEKTQNENNIFVRTIYQTLFIQRQFAMLEIFWKFSLSQILFLLRVDSLRHIQCDGTHEKRKNFFCLHSVGRFCLRVAQREKQLFHAHTHMYIHAYYVVHGKLS